VRPVRWCHGTLLSALSRLGNARDTCKHIFNALQPLFCCVNISTAYTWSSDQFKHQLSAVDNISAAAAGATAAPAAAAAAAELWAGLVSSGLDATASVLWLLEGFIGAPPARSPCTFVCAGFVCTDYLTMQASSALRATVSQLAAVGEPGSSILITAPPTPD
jgi:hypothetical protein